MLPGSFKLGTVTRVTDPCFSRDISNHLLRTKPGVWWGAILAQNWSVWELLAWHVTAGSLHEAQSARRRALFPVDVDEGMAGIFADASYPEGQTGVSTFYGRAVDATCGPLSAGIIKEGVVSASGCGDGTYDCFFETEDGKADGKVTAIRIVFLPLPKEEY